MSGIVPMQEGLYKLCKKQIDNEPDFKKYLGKDKVDTVDQTIFEEFRLYKLKKTLSYVYNNSKFYRELFDKNGVKPQDVKSIADLAKLPLTTPQDLAERQFDFLCVSQSKVARVITFTSSGTVGPKKRIFFTGKDIEVMTDFMGVGMNTVTGPEGVVQILLPDGPVMGQSDLLARGVKKIGAKSILTGMLVPTEEQIQAIIEHGSTVLFGETRLIYRITKEAEQKYDLSKLGVKILFVTTSYLSDTMRTNLESAWNCKVFTHYGLTEMGLGLAVDCPYNEGYHFDELDVIAEVIDPETGEILPDGEEGELVFTSITREAMPFIRYRSHDIARLTSKPCKCGATLGRISHVSRRLESLVEIGEGQKIYSTMFDDVLFTIPEIVDYDIVLNKVDGKDSLLFKVEVTQGKEGLKEQIEKELLNIDIIYDNVRKGKLTIPEIEIEPLGSLRGGIYYKKMIKDMR